MPAGRGPDRWDYRRRRGTKSTHAYRTIWNCIKFRGRGTHPRTQESTELARRHARVNTLYGFLWAIMGGLFAEYRCLDATWNKASVVFSARNFIHRQFLDVPAKFAPTSRYVDLWHRLFASPIRFKSSALIFSALDFYNYISRWFHVN